MIAQSASNACYLASVLVVVGFLLEYVIAALILALIAAFVAASAAAFLVVLLTAHYCSQFLVLNHILVQ